MFTAMEVFDLAIQVEENGERFYRYALGMVREDSLKNVLGLLADQELEHRSAFLEIRERIVDKTNPCPFRFPSESASFAWRNGPPCLLPG